MSRRTTIQLISIICVLTVLSLAAHFTPPSAAAASDTDRASASQRQATAAATASSFDTATVITPGQTIADALDDNTLIHSYKFNGKAGEQYRIVVTVTSGNFYTSLSVVSGDLIHVLGESDGATLIDSTLHFAIPADGLYGVIVSYLGATVGTPTPGKYTITLSAVAAHP